MIQAANSLYCLTPDSNDITVDLTITLMFTSYTRKSINIENSLYICLILENTSPNPQPLLAIHILPIIIIQFKAV